MLGEGEGSLPVDLSVKKKGHFGPVGVWKKGEAFKRK